MVASFGFVPGSRWPVLFDVMVVATLLAALGSPAAAQSTCAGDCDGSGAVAVNELVTLVNIALGSAEVATCLAGDANGDGAITIDEILTAVNNALNGCPVPQLCGGIAGIACPSGQFCEYPAAMCNAADLAGVCLPLPGACVQSFAPVCGCDGKTYANDCERQVARVAKDHDGAC
jgi:hypothetical protein